MRWPQGRFGVGLIGVAGELVPPLPGPQLTLEVDDDRVGGSAGINRFAGLISADGGLGELAITRRAGSPESMEQERRYLMHLSNVDAVSGTDLSASGIVVLSLVAIA
jgi:heat shock protein HslJ